ncbi:MAG: PAS domain S-box protein, partial [Promethearchaeota archaeon]
QDILTNLKEIQHTIINQIELYKPSIDVLKIAELHYSTLFKAAQDTILIIDRKSGIIIDANKKSEDLFELPSEDFVGLHASQLLIDDMSKSFKEKIFENIGNPTPIMVNVISHSGNIIPVEINVNEVQMGGQVLVQCIIRDISKRIETELKLMDSEIKYRHLFEDSPFCIFLMDPKGYIVDCNPAMEKIFGYSRDELIYKKFINLPIIHEDYLVEFVKRFKEELRDTDFPPIDIQIYNKNKDIVWITLQNSFVRIGKETFYQVICYDVTEQKKAEKELEKVLKLESIIARIISRFIGIKDFNQAIYDSLKDIAEFTNSRRAYFYIFNEKYSFIGKRIVWHAQILHPEILEPEILSLEDFPWLNKKLRNSVHLIIDDIKSLPVEAMRLEKFLETQKIQNCIIHSIKINDSLEGLIWFANFSDPFSWKEENFEPLGFFSDILKNAILREISKEDLRKSEELFHKEFDREYFYRELFVNDFNEIMKNLQTFVSQLADQKDLMDSITGKEILNNIKQQNVNGQQLLSVIQKLTKIEELSPSIKKVNLKECIDKAIHYIVSLYTNKKINIVIEVPGEDIYVKADEYLVDIFTNLLFSSLRYNQDQSIELKIIVFRSQQDEKKFVKIEFIDYRKVISDFEKEEILKMERKKDSKIREILLGFLLVERILDNYYGKIWVEGDSFVVLIPEAID